MRLLKKLPDFRIPLIFIILTITGFSACDKEMGILDNEPKPIKLTTEQQLLLGNSSDFSFDLFREIINEADKTENVFISPLSISIALAMTYNGAAGSTQAAMKKTMQLPDLSVKQINEAYLSLRNDLLSVDPKVILNIANSIWYREGFDVEVPFINANKTYYDAEVRDLDFDRPDAVTIINNWVSDKTNNLIDKIIERITNQTVMILLNAIYFKGEWRYEFDKSETTSLPFHLENGQQITVPTMRQTGSFNYFEHELFSVAELPYGRGNYSMLVFLPNTGKEVHEMVEVLNNKLWSEITDGLSFSRMLNIQLPKFRFEFEQELNDVLISMGMGVAFSPAQADFSGINPLEQLFISEVKHKAFVEVNEEGTEAAAVTSVVIERTSAGPNTPKAFLVDRPFVFAIKETYTNAIIFAGKVMEPVLE